jgi:hypothetical protein
LFPFFYSEVVKNQLGFHNYLISKLFNTKKKNSHRKSVGTGAIGAGAIGAGALACAGELKKLMLLNTNPGLNHRLG